MRKILVFAPHSDDETLGAGGMLLKSKNQGDEIYWVNVTRNREIYGSTKEEEKSGQEEISLVVEKYRINKLFDLGLEPAGLDKYRISELIGMFSEIVKEVAPQVILMPYRNDIHTDHRIVFDAVFACTKAFRYPSIKKILSMEIISETDYAYSDMGFVPNYYVDISDYIDNKIEIMKIYKDEIKNSPFPRNEEAIRGLAKYRGAACNVEYAEAFRIIKEIE